MTRPAVGWCGPALIAPPNPYEGIATFFARDVRWYGRDPLAEPGQWLEVMRGNLDLSDDFARLYLGERPESGSI